VRAIAAISYPSAAKAIATALPIPLLAPVITATGLSFMGTSYYQDSQKIRSKDNNLPDYRDISNNYLTDNLSALFNGY
jgi:hypothetical protein